MRRRAAAAALLLALGGPAIAGGTAGRTDAAPEIRPPPGARLPPGLPVRDEAGRALTLGEALAGRPTVFAFADYTCTVLCGTALGLAAATLPETGLRPGLDYGLVVLGLDPRDGPAEAAAMKRAYLGKGGALAAAARFLTAEAPAIAAAEAAVGYRVRYQGPAADGFDHPLALLVLAPDGRLSEVLPGLGARPEALRAALLLAAASPADGGGALSIGVRLLCQGIGLPSGGARGAAVLAALAVGGAVTLLGMAGGGALLVRCRQKREQGG